MPERVHIRFDDSDDQKSRPVSSQTNGTLPKKKKVQQIEYQPRGKKRKRDDQASSLDQQRQSSEKQQSFEKKQSTAKRQSLEKRQNYEKGQNGPENGSANGPAHPLNAKRMALLEFRKKLPIWTEQETIRQALRKHDVLVLSGETGSGKSTQVPQFLLQEQWCSGRIAVTQPRRVAAISLARRVAEEVGTLLGSSSPASKVGYSVRFDNSTSPSTRIKFLTEGMLLQEMLRDAALKEYSAIIVDEVHERSVNVDLILGFLRNLLGDNRQARGGKRLKVIVMSATADTDKLVKFFDDGYQSRANKLSTNEIPANGDAATIDNAQRQADSDFDESGSTWSGFSDSPKVETPRGMFKDSKKENLKAAKSIPASTTKANGIISNGTPDSKAGMDSTDHSKFVSTCFVQGRQFPVETVYLPEPTNDILEASVKAIFQIHYKEALPGDILVFLTGQEAIETVERQINDLATAMDTNVPKILTLPLFAALPQAAQQQIFQPAPPRTRKIILSTNIAETSVTVPGIRHVIDCGKAKMKLFHHRIGLEALLAKPISQSAAIQRKGRAGRDAPGKCYRLYTEADYLKLETNTRPEILRCDLSQSILIMQARGVQQVLGFPLLDPPPEQALKKALLLLLDIGALDEKAQINEIGQKLAKLPLTPTMGRVLVEAAKPEMECVEEIIDILACLSVENVFINPATEEKREAAEAARRDLFRREGDHLTLLTTARAYAAEETDRRQWAESRWVSHRAMQNVMVRKQFSITVRRLTFAERPKTAARPVQTAWPTVQQCFASNGS